MPSENEQIELIYSSPSESNDQGTWWKQLHDCRFAGSTGWACGSDQLLRTLDAGQTWKSLRAPADGVHKVCAIDAWNAYLLGYTTTEFALWYTGDAGDHWQKLFTDRDLDSNSIFFHSRGKFGLTINGRGPGRRRMLLATLGSDKWIEYELNVPGEPASVVFQQSGAGLMTVSICDPSEVDEQRRIEKIAENDESTEIPLILPKRSLIFATESERLEWTELSSIDSWISNLLTTDKATFAYGHDGIYRSLDYGQSWSQTQIELPEGVSVNSITSVDDLMVAVGDFGYLAFSDDNGETWKNCSLEARGEHYIAASPSGSDLIVVGCRHIRRVRLQAGYARRLV